MSLVVACSHCGRSLKIPEQVLGKTVKCPLCQQPFIVQATAPPATPEVAGGTVVVACSSCRRSLKISRAHLGRTLRCPVCQATFTAQIEVASEESVAAGPPAPRPRPAPPPLPKSAVSSGPPPVGNVPAGHELAPVLPEDAIDDREDDAPSASKPPRFKIVIKKDPKKRLKGVYLATVTGQGLKLQQGKKEAFTIPIGTQARHDKGNVLSVALDDRRVDLAIFPFGLYAERLAGDVAAVLEGRRRRLNPAGYRIPWYLFVPAVLPLGIPIITLGGAIPAAVGVGLAGGCLAVAQRERWPVAARLGIMLGLVLAGYIALIGFLIAVNQFRPFSPAVTVRLPVPPQPNVRPPDIAKGPVVIEEKPPPQNSPDAQGRVFLAGDAVGLAFLPGAPNTLATVNNNGTVALWDTVSAQARASIAPKNIGQEVTAMAVAPDGKKAVVVRHGGQVQTIDLVSRQWDPPWQETMPAQPAQWAVAWSRDGRTVATANGDRCVRLWDVPTRSLRHTLAGHVDQVHAVAIAPDSTTVASADGVTVRLWNAQTGQATGTFQAQDKGAVGLLHAVWALAFSPDGKLLAAGGNDGSVRIRDLGANREAARLPQGQPVSALVFSSDNALLASAGFKGSIKVWFAATGAHRAEMQLPDQRVQALAFQPDRSRLAISGGRITLWDLPSN
jgi:hypothetical protein